jgi:tetratricopeptide (TPR) repeat protein
MRGRFADSIRELEKGLAEAQEAGQSGWQDGFHLQLAYTMMRLGRAKEALAACRLAASELYARHLDGLICLAAGDMTGVETAVEELGRDAVLQNGHNKKRLRFRYHLLGCRALREGGYSGALDHLDRAMTLSSHEWVEPDLVLNAMWYYFGYIQNPQALFVNSRARAHALAGNRAEALRNHEQILEMTAGRFYYGDIYARTFYTLGQIREEMGQRDSAIEHYSKFVELWQDCDPEFRHLVDDARARVARLQGSK